MSILLSAVSPTLQYIGVTLANPAGLVIKRGKVYVALGPNGSGKSTLAMILERGWNIAMNRIEGDRSATVVRRIEFSDIHSLTGSAGGYYQQRFEATANDDVPTVAEVVARRWNHQRWQCLCSALELSDIADKRINYLSSGELRKFLIAGMLDEDPDLLILDNPYIGLDEQSRGLLNSLISQIAAGGTAVMLLLCNPHDMPCFTDVVVPVKDLCIMPSVEVSGRVESMSSAFDTLFASDADIAQMPEYPMVEPSEGNVVELNDCRVAYSGRTILEHVDWQIAPGERWALLGRNGSGKSTLLSLIYADNPQGYRNNITLFGLRRGTGESIWDIKRRIAYISPEMHLYFNNDESVLRVVASGLSDYVGCYRTPAAEANELAIKWLATLGMAHLANRRFPTLSSGEQRLALLARTFMKNASLIILDEPLHGLDAERKRIVAEVIERRMADPSVALIYVTHYRNEIPRCVGHVKELSRNL